MKKIKIHCERYRHLRKKIIDVEMGSISKRMMKIAREFYATQVDICDPLTHTPFTTKEQKPRIILTNNLLLHINFKKKYKSNGRPKYTSFYPSLRQFSCKVECPNFIVIDEGSQKSKVVTA